MKTKVIIAVLLSAIVTVSFTFSSSKSKTQPKNEAAAKQDQSAEPVGGLALEEDKF